MEYSIGDVSKILHISKEMIRYYEKQGALKPSRKEDNNYRTYSTMDVFFLMEIIRYQAVGLSIKEITNLLEDNFMDNYANYLESFRHRLQEEVTLKLLLKERIKEMALRAKTSQMNLNKYWFKEIPTHDLVFLCEEKNDEYNQISIHKKNRHILFNEMNFAFFESVVLFEENGNTWWYGINQEYNDILHLDYVNEKSIPQALCLCSVVNMGEIGEFDSSVLEPIFQYMDQMGYEMEGVIRGMIVCRGFQEKEFQRILEIQVPIKH